MKDIRKPTYQNESHDGSTYSQCQVKEIESFEKYEDKIIKYLSMKLKKIPKEDSELAKERN